MKDCLRHFKYKFRTRVVKLARWSIGIYEIIHMLSNYDSLDCNEEKPQKRQRREQILGADLRDPVTLSRASGLHCCLRL